MIAWPEGSRRRRMRFASVAVLAAGALAVAGCGGGDSSSDLDGTVAGYVPAGSPLYYEVTTVLDGPQWRTVDGLAKQFPGYPDLVREFNSSLAEEQLDFDGDIRPHLGERAAIALTRIDGAAAAAGANSDDPAAGVTASSSMLGVVDIADGSRAAVEELIARRHTATGEHAGATIYGPAAGENDQTTIAVNDDVLLISDTPAEITGALDASNAGGDATLAGTASFKDSLGKLPEDVFGKTYIDVGALVRAGNSAGPDMVPPDMLAQFGEGVFGAAVIAEANGLRIKGVASNVKSVESLTEFSPELVKRAPANALAFGELANITQIIRTQVEAMRASAEPEMLEQIDAFTQALPDLLGVELASLAALGEGRQALVVVPGKEIPGAVLMSQVADPAEALRTLDALRVATPTLAGAAGSLTGGDVGTNVPTWRPATITPDISGWQLPIEDGIGLTYAVDGDVVLLGTSPAALAAVIAPSNSLADDADFTAATTGMPESVSSVSWVNLAAITEMADRVGAFDGAPAESKANIEPLRDFAYWDTGGDEPTFEGFLRIGS